MNERGNFSLVVNFFIIAFLLTFLFILLAPSLQKYTVVIFNAAEPILTDGNTTASQITNTSVKDQLQDLYQNQADNTTTNMDILGTLYQYAWLIILIVTAIMVFLFSRSVVEAQTGRYV